MKQVKLVAANQLPERLDKFLARELEAEFHFSRATIQKMIGAQRIKVNKTVVTLSKALVIEGDKIEIEIPTVQAPLLQPQQLNIPIIYQDKDFLVINKPNNLVVHSGAGKETQTLVTGLLGMGVNLSQVDEWRPGIVHRLDKQTTGLLIVAKNNLIHQKLSAMFANHQINKEYLALVSGVIKESAGKIEMPIGRSANNRKKMAVVVNNGKRAVTHFEVLERFENATLVKVNLETGRTHQIRVHFKQIQHPIYNDPVYSSAIVDPHFGQFLHANYLSFKHPNTQKMMEFSAPLPQPFADKIKELKEKTKVI